MPSTRVSTCLLCVTLIAGVAVTAVARGEDKPDPAAPGQPPKVIRVGIIGLDTSHAPAFTEAFNAESPAPELAGVRIVAAFPGGSADIPSSIGRVPQYTEKVKARGVEIVDSIPALLERVDVVLLESVDGRPHLEQARPVFEAKKPVFIDKPLAGTLADGIAIAELGKKHGVPWFSASSLRFSPGIASMRSDPRIGDVRGCDTWSPCALNEHHPDLFWYGIHGVETLYTIMGTGCLTVARTHTADTDFVVGRWNEGRVGTFRGIRKGKPDYGAMVFGTKGNAPSGNFAGYQPLLVEIAKFFKTGKPPVSPEETIEILAFMEAADESKRQNGRPVKLKDVLEKARAEAAKRAK